MLDRDYSLLKPFEPMFDIDGEGPIRALVLGGECGCKRHLIETIDVVGSDKAHCIGRSLDGSVGVWQLGDVFIAPLCWLRGKPVYPGALVWRGTFGWQTAVSVFSANGRKYLRYSGDNGNSSINKDGNVGTSEPDLLWEAPKVRVEKEGWINLYPPVSPSFAVETTHAYKTEALADEHCDPATRIACVRITWTEEVAADA